MVSFLSRFSLLFFNHLSLNVTKFPKLAFTTSLFHWNWYRYLVRVFKKSADFQVNEHENQGHIMLLRIFSEWWRHTLFLNFLICTLTHTFRTMKLQKTAKNYLRNPIFMYFMEKHEKSICNILHPDHYYRAIWTVFLLKQ